MEEEQKNMLPKILWLNWGTLVCQQYYVVLFRFSFPLFKKKKKKKKKKMKIDTLFSFVHKEIWNTLTKDGLLQKLWKAEVIQRKVMCILWD